MGNDARTLVAGQREFFDSGRTREIPFRVRMLQVLKEAVITRRSDILGALRADLGKPRFEAYAAEVGQLVLEADLAIKRLARWSRPRKVSTPSFLFRASSFVYPEPLGVALIIAPWNYPVSLLFSPLIGAIAAGNCAVLKPSEISQNTSALIADIVSRDFDRGFVAAVEGGPDETGALLEERFDHIFYTGGGAVGRVVMEAASRHLTPITLELGGKSPCIVEADARLELAARRIAWGKFFNAGQTCIAPDYLLVQRAAKDELLEGISGNIRRFYGEDAASSPDYARIVSDRHFRRLEGLLGQGEIFTGGGRDAAARFIEPTVMTGVDPGSELMTGEIFGPILPVVEYGDLSEAIAFVAQRPKPLALYFFSGDREKQRAVLAETSSGSACINDTVVQYANLALPFGGAGASGFGKYHGKHTFDTFSNMKSVVSRSAFPDVYLRYPPYQQATRLIQRIIRYVT